MATLWPFFFPVNLNVCQMNTKHGLSSTTSEIKTNMVCNTLSHHEMLLNLTVWAFRKVFILGHHGNKNTQGCKFTLLSCLKISVFLKRVSKRHLEIFKLMFYLVVLKRTVMLNLHDARQVNNSDVGQRITLHYEDVEFSFKLEPFQKCLSSNSKRQN